MRGEQDRVLAPQFGDQRADLPDLVWIQPDSGLIEDEDRWIVNERLRQPQTLAVSLGELVDDSVLHIAETAAADDLLDARARLAAGDSFEPGAVVQELLHPHLAVGGDVFRQVPDVAAHLQRMQLDIVACDLGGAGCRPDERREDPHRGGLSRPVRSEEAHDLAALDREVQLLDGGRSREALRQRLDLDHRFSGFTPMKRAIL